MIQEQFTLDCAFLHAKLVFQLINPTLRSLTEQRIAGGREKFAGGLGDTFANSVLTDAVLDILKKQEVQSLEEKLFRNEPCRQGELVWMEQDFYFKGASKAKTIFSETGQSSYVTFYTTLQRYQDLKISGRFNAAHLFGDSSVYAVSGRKNVFIFAFVREVSATEIELRPIFIGLKMILGQFGLNRTTDYLQVFAEDISEFSKCREVTRRSVKIDDNKLIPETAVKKYFAEIIYQGFVPKDWAGEKSDLFCDHVHVGGQRCNAAFLLKGPSNFEPMTFRNIGKGQDQILRLYEEPAELFILQHCHYVKPEIYKLMRTFSSDFTRISRYCIIDGEDTLRILKAYGKI